jgi:acetyl/propionyl-CoA carboxylase alpha subunit
MTSDLRARMSAAATELGRLLKYEGAGTVEFIVDAKTCAFYFLEVNTRVQVEHPITEETTLVDIVALQIYVASGGLLSQLPYLKNLKQHVLPSIPLTQGHAIELRLCAEDPMNNFLPCTGTIRRFSTIHETTGSKVKYVRYETGVETGSEISVYFDPMIAKIVVWAPDRPGAIRLAKRVLASTTILGLGTNQEFLGRCLAHPAFQDKHYTTGFIETYRDELFRSVDAENERIAVLTSGFLKYIADSERRANGAFRSISSKFRVQSMDRSSVKAEHITIGGRGYIVQYLPRRGEATDTVQVWPIPEHNLTEKQKGKFLNKAGGILVHRYYAAITPPSQPRTMEISIIHATLRRQGGLTDPWIEADITVQLDGVVKTVFVATEGDWHSRDDSPQTLWIHEPELCAGIKSVRRSLLTFAGRLDERSTGSAAELGSSILDMGNVDAGGSYLAPMPCRILQVIARDGSHIKKGEGLLVMESMKTEVKLTARSDGIVKMKCKEGDSISEGGLLCEIVEASKSD